MGTQYAVKIVDIPPNIQPKQVHEALETRLQAINALMSTYQKDSELSRFNQNPSTDWVAVSPELLYVVQAALNFSRLSDGAFDISVGPLVNLWGFGPTPKADQIPTAAEIAAAKARVGYQRVHVRENPPALRKDIPDVYLDLSALAEGYAADQLANYLVQLGIKNYLVDIGGELRLAGHNAEDQQWRVAIEQPDPNPSVRTVERVVALPDTGVATSGSYRNFFQWQGQTYSHTIDPHTGSPVSHRLVSVTVLHPESMQADALATTFMVLGVEKALALAEREQLAVYLLEDTETGIVEHYSKAFAGFVQAQAAQVSRYATYRLPSCIVSCLI